MRLKKLTVFGFKSFAEKVVLDFDCSIIGIVGPNGCGKSNIVDAFRWVTGEQSAKSLRGDKMHDVLFAGTEQRKALNYAEVSVTLTDIEGKLPVPYEELTITRRLHRSGESEYFINREAVRLKDVQALFLGSGIGKNAFSIFEQGKLDQIIHLNPMERRLIFDEAAGTSRFLLRKKETVRKLGSVTENYTRIKDIHTEIGAQAKQLKKQAISAKTYQENTENLHALEKKVLIFRFQKIDQKNRESNEKLELICASLNAAQKEIGNFEIEFSRVKHDVTVKEIAAKEQQKELNVCQTKVRVQESEIHQLRSRVLEIKKREESVKEQLCVIGEEQKGRLSEIEKKEQQQKAYSHKENLKEIIKKGREEHIKKMSLEKQLSNELQKTVFSYESKKGRLSSLVELEKKNESVLSGVAREIDVQKEKVRGLTHHIESFKGEIDQLEKSLQSLRKENTEKMAEEQQLLRKKTETESHLKSLNRLKEEMEGFSTGAKALLKEAKNEKSPLYGKIEPLFEYLKPQKGYEELLASSMKSYLETLVVASKDEFQELLTFAKAKKVTGFSVIVKSEVKASKAKKTSLAAFVEQNAIACHLTDGIDIAEDHNFYDVLGVFFHKGEQKKLNNVFHRQAEIAALTEAFETENRELKAAITLREQIAEQLKVVEKKRSEVSETRRKIEMDLIKENFALQRALTDHEKLKSEKAHLAKEKENLSHFEKDVHNIEKLQKELETVKKEAGALLETLLVDEGLLEKWQEVNQQILIIKAKQQQSLVHEKKMLEEQEELKERSIAVIKTLGSNEEELERSKIQHKRLESALKEKERELFDAKKEGERYEKELNLKRKGLSPLEKEIHALEIALTQSSVEKNAIAEELSKRYQLETIPQEAVMEEGDLESVNREIGRLRHAVAGAGAVNMTAISEYQETQGRFEFLDKQLQDLESSKKDLEDVITKLDQESRKIFKKTFQQIRENFQKNFAILFNGGSADLTFTDSSDVLEAGVEIVAKPPGKQLRSISLLSGGEKCLTALALLFSIFEVKAAPFCILDEVDAPLDDSNIDRFTNVLKQFIDKTQFIIVTHNKKTMAIADLLIGVSMEEKGVSKLISLALEKKAAVLT